MYVRTYLKEEHLLLSLPSKHGELLWSPTHHLRHIQVRHLYGQREKARRIMVLSFLLFRQSIYVVIVGDMEGFVEWIKGVQKRRGI